MKNIKDFDEREKSMYNEYRKQTFTIIIIEAIVGTVVATLFPLNDFFIQIGILVMILIPVIFNRIKVLSICEIEKHDIFISGLLAAMWSTYLLVSDNGNNSILKYGLVCILWGLAICTVLVWRYQVRENDE